jgi:hypothetical protein
MRLTSEKQIPSKIQAFATMCGLGTPRIVYEKRQVPRHYFFVGPLAIVVGSAIIVAYMLLYESIFSWWMPWKASMVLLIGIAWCCVGLWITVPLLLMPRLRLYLCPKGLIYAKRKLEVIHWSHIAQAVQKIDVDKHKHIVLSYVIRRDDGRIFILNDDLPYIDRLYGFIEKEVARQLLPTAIRACDSGIPQEFAEVTIFPQGIGLKQEGRVLPWTSFDRVELDKTVLSIYSRVGGWDWATVGLSNLPNVEVLLGLVEHYSKGTSNVLQSSVVIPQIQAYNAGFTIFFGRMGMNKAGIKLDSNEELIPWQEIANFGISEDAVIIQRNGSLRTWYTVPLWMINDVASLRQLVDYVLYEG